MLTALSIPIEPLEAYRCEPYGWMLGKPVRTDGDAPAFVSPASDFWREHLFDTGTPGETEILWVVYRNRGAEISALELHRLTQQAIVPLTAPVVPSAGSRTEDSTVDGRVAIAGCGTRLPIRPPGPALCEPRCVRQCP